MSRHSRHQPNALVVPIIILIGAAAWVHRVQLVHLAFISLGVIGFLLPLKLSGRFMDNSHFAHFQNVDVMDGLEFEQYVAKLLRANGYRKVS